MWIESCTSVEFLFFVQLYSIPVQSAFENNFFGQNNKLYPLRIKVCESCWEGYNALFSWEHLEGSLYLSALWARFDWKTIVKLTVTWTVFCGGLGRRKARKKSFKTFVQGPAAFQFYQKTCDKTKEMDFLNYKELFGTNKSFPVKC